MLNQTFFATLLPAAIAAVVSAGTAFFTIRVEMDKAVIAAQQSALHQIIEARLSAYPQAYRLVSQLNKDAQRIDRAYLERLRSDFDPWDSGNGHLLGPASTNTVHKFRNALLTAISQSESKNFNISQLLVLAGEVELALRSDLGIYGFHLKGPSRGLETPVGTY